MFSRIFLTLKIRISNQNEFKIKRCVCCQLNKVSTELTTDLSIFLLKNNSIELLKVSVFGVFLVRIFPHSDWIRRDTKLVSPYSVWMRENTDQKNSKYEKFSRSDWCVNTFLLFAGKIILPFDWLKAKWW